MKLMLEAETKIEIRYDEVDKMGYVYHGNYAKYYQISRTELMNSIGICDKKLERQHILLPVVEMNIKYRKPVFYGDTITVKTSITELPLVRMNFSHKVYNQKNELINEASSTLVFVDSESRLPIRIPEEIVNKLELHI